MHLIHKHRVSINTNSKPTGMEMQSVVTSVFENELYPKMALLFDKYALPEKLVKLEEFTVHISLESKSNWKHKIVTQTLEQLEEYLKSLSFNTSNNTVEPTFSKSPSLKTKQEDLRLLFFEYLTKGILQENVWVSTLEELWTEIIFDDEIITKISSLILQDFNNLERWINTIPEHVKSNFLKQINQSFFQLKEEVYLKALSKLIEIAALKKELQYFNWLIIAYRHIINPTSTLLKCLKTFESYYSLKHRSNSVSILFESIAYREFKQPKPTSPFDVPTVTNELLEIEKLSKQDIIEQDAKHKIIGEPIYLQNSGLIILHPYLPQFFEEVELMKNKQWIDEKAQARGILLSQYLVTGHTVIFENELVLNKFLCGYPITNAIDTAFNISKNEAEICNDLLLQVIEHWKKLKNTSISTLREAFLQKKGKLKIEENNGSQLIVEQKSIDLLLDYLPWGIRIIKTPWMTNELQCIWN